jgi:hypothetical protein
MPIKTSGNPPVEKEKGSEEAVDYQRGISQENLEDLRAEYSPIGVILTSLPEPSEVRDWTMAGIITTDVSGEDVMELNLMADGRWWNLNDYRATKTGASGNINMLNVVGTYLVAVADTHYEFNTTNASGSTDHWDLTDENNMSYDDGVFTILRAGRFAITWSCGFTCGTNNREYEMGIMLNGVQTYGWSQRKIGTSGDVGSMSAQTILELKKNDKISLGYLCIANTTSVLVSHANLTLNRIR